MQIGGASAGWKGARPPLLLPLALTVLLLLASAAVGLAHSSREVLAPTPALDEPSVPPAIMPAPMPYFPPPQNTIRIGAIHMQVFGAATAPSRGFAAGRQDAAKWPIGERLSLQSSVDGKFKRYEQG